MGRRWYLFYRSTGWLRLWLAMAPSAILPWVKLTLKRAGRSSSSPALPKNQGQAHFPSKCILCRDHFTCNVDFFHLYIILKIAILFVNKKSALKIRNLWWKIPETIPLVDSSFGGRFLSPEISTSEKQKKRAKSSLSRHIKGWINKILKKCI